MTNSDIKSKSAEILACIRSIYGLGKIPLHRPVFEGNERNYLLDCIDSNFVSTAGERVSEFEQQVATYTGARYGIATVNGTAALHTSLMLSGVESGDEVITQALTFVATANAIQYTGARPVFIDVDRDTLGMSPSCLRAWLEKNTHQENGTIVNKESGARISACVPMHTFGIPSRILELSEICDEFGIALVEDAAESLGSYAGSRHTGTIGKIGAFSFNGNKIITTGGGGVLVTNDTDVAKRAKHLTTTAKKPSPYDYYHDIIGYNYRLPNLNAALGVAQMEVLPKILEIKAEVASHYREFCKTHDFTFIEAPEDTTSNYWLNGLILKDRATRDYLLEKCNQEGVMTRPIWRLMSELPMYESCQNDGLRNSRWLADRVINLPSSVPDSEIKRIEI